ncbi:hypothetical protein ACJX0J_013902, partial [Zea mays]
SSSRKIWLDIVLGMCRIHDRWIKIYVCLYMLKKCCIQFRKQGPKYMLASDEDVMLMDGWQDTCHAREG